MKRKARIDDEIGFIAQFSYTIGSNQDYLSGGEGALKFFILERVIHTNCHTGYNNDGYYNIVFGIVQGYYK